MSTERNFDPKLGLAGEAVQSCIQALHLVKGDTNILIDGIKDRITKLRLWADGFEVQNGGLDRSLEYSQDLKEAVYVALYDLVQTIGKCRMIQCALP